MTDTMAVVLTGSNDCDLGELTRLRSVAAIPFAGRYRLVDFALSNLVNSGIVNVGVATDYNYQSLLDHLGSGKPWGLARKKYGLTFLPPFASENSSADERMKMLLGILHYLKRSQQKYVIVADCNVVCNMTFNRAVEEHKESGAELTVVYAESEEKQSGVFVTVDKNGGVNGFADTKEIKKHGNKLVGYYIFTKDLLVNVLERCQMLGKRDFFQDLLGTYFARNKVAGYLFDGYFAQITDTNSYYSATMDLMNTDVRKGLFFADNRILTKIKDRSPTKYLMHADVADSMIADGCVIDGKVQNCILFRGVTVEKGADVKNCIIMQNSVVSKNVRLASCIIDKDCVILPGRELVGQPDFPIVVGKRRTI
ncbi:MAG: glucose-1-phosphate adenylyltransferase subunit GlgD [Corallococcus sp.]|nr:glucose-1-phosphate adenylyltransferase subunit GlgD [Corallococcus sp.]MCM1359305.1 glucose-1-phosphate adenylyltransferase subunit GlgD [Corallococcus sp.]MCM1394884.1 glucose-1-phosphate adenylyltransferase subunit GlgD [Corallococcus sp.]